MGSNKIMIDIKKLDSIKKKEYYNEILWQQIDSALAPPKIVTLLVMSGVFAGYYYHNYYLKCRVGIAHRPYTTEKKDFKLFNLTVQSPH
jgi:hypothetical protein